jgi:hypothetical protein
MDTRIQFHEAKDEGYPPIVCRRSQGEAGLHLIFFLFSLSSSLFPLNYLIQMVHVKGQEISQELLKWEQRGVFKSYKFGILYCKEGQSTEEEIFGNGTRFAPPLSSSYFPSRPFAHYANSTAEHGSPDFEEFLNCMGEKISLKGWTQYSGGLNVDGNFKFF